MGVFKAAGEYAKAYSRHSLLGVADEFMGNVFQAGFSTVTGFGKGILGKKLNLTNVSGMAKLTHTLGYGVGRVGVTAAKPVITLGKKMIKNTPKEAKRMFTGSGKFTKGVRDFAFEKVERGTPNSILGYRAKKRTSRILLAGAAGIGVAQSAGDANYNLGLRTAVNGIMDTEGVAITPGSINPSYTPVYNTPNNHGATGEIPLALHNRRHTGYL